MTCVMCKTGRPRPGAATATFDHEGETFVIRGVPAQVCPQCGEAYYDAATSARLLDLVILATRSGTTVRELEYTDADLAGAADGRRDAVRPHGSAAHRMPLGRVLIVEDEPQVADMIRDVLTSLAYESTSALNGPDALRLARLYQPDVVLLDILMPGMSGAEMLDVLRRDYPDVPVVMVTALQDEESARQTLARGAFDFVRKPFDLDVLARILLAALVYRGEGSASGAAASVRPPGRQRRTLLYIEDNPANVRLVEMLLEQRPGVQLLTASEGHQGLAIARAFRPDLIFLDLHLPDMEGEDVLRAIRDDPDVGRTPVIVLSAEAHPTLPAQMLAAGARAYLMKPFDFRQFFALLDASLPPGGGAV